MLTRREVFKELRRIGIREQSLLREYFQDFEDYMEISYGLKIASTKTEPEKKRFKQNFTAVKQNQY